MNLKYTALVIGTALAIGSTPALAGAYNFTEIIVPNGEYCNTQVTGLNDNDVVVGYLNPCRKRIEAGWVWANGQLTELPDKTVLNAVSTSGIAVGSSVNKAMTYNISTGVISRLKLKKVQASTALAINTSGTIAGLAYPDSGGVSAFVRTGHKLQTFTLNPSPPDGVSNILINSAGNLAGTYGSDGFDLVGFTVTNGVVASFNVTGAKDTSINLLGDDGSFGGSYTTSDDHTHGYTYSSGTVTTYDAPGEADTYINDRNSSDTIVGEETPASGPSTGFVLIGGTYHTINFPIETSFGGGILHINSTGDIIGFVIDQYGHIRIYIGQCPANQRPCTQ